MISGWTGIPIGQMQTDEAHALRTLVARMSERVMGQQAALETIAQRLRAYRSGLTDPQNRSACFCWWDQPAWAKPKPPMRWPMLCTAANAI